MKKHALLICIVLLGLFLRIYKVTEIPPSLSWDEVSIGYNAYSILRTGYDEHHRFLPLDTFAGFGDYKPPVPIYLTVIPVAIFGLNEFSVRLPSVLFGTLTVLLTYYLVIELLKNSRYEGRHQRLVAIASSLLLAISPWHIQLSRAGFEANIAVFFIVASVVLLLKAREDKRLFIVSWIPLVLSIYTFNSARYFSVLLGLALLIFLGKYIRAAKKHFAIGIIVAAVLMLPIMPHLFSKEARLRFEEVNIFTDLSIVEKANERIAYRPGFLTNILHNRRVGYLRSYLIHYLDHFQPWFLFLKGDGNPKFSIQDVGQLYPIELPFLIAGIYALFRSDARVAWFLLGWILLSIVPAAVARETPHALRIENSLPVWQIFCAAGIVSIGSSIKKRARLTKAVIIGAYVLSFGYYWHNYYNHYAKEYSGEWQYGYREAIQYVKTVYDLYDTIIISDAIGRPYIYTLFHMAYEPTRYWASVKDTFDAAGFYHVFRFDKFVFIRSKEQVSAAGRILYVLAPDETPVGARVLKTIYKLNGEPALHIVNQ